MYIPQVNKESVYMLKTIDYKGVMVYYVWVQNVADTYNTDIGWSVQDLYESTSSMDYRQFVTIVDPDDDEPAIYLGVYDAGTEDEPVDLTSDDLIAIVKLIDEE